MSKLDQFFADQPGNQPNSMTIEVDVSCQYCFEYVDDAEYFPLQKLLKWKCSQGHISFIEEFRL